MSSAALTQFLVDVTRGPRADAFAADPHGVVAASSLEPALRSAVLGHDVAALWLAGAHPMALMYFARALGWANERYYGCIGEAEVRRGAAAAAGPPAPSAPSRTRPPSAPHAR